MFKLLKYLKEYKKESIIGPLFKLLEASFELIVPLVMASIIDIGIKNRDLSHIYKMGAIMIFLGILGLACSLTAQYFAAKAAVGFGTILRKELFAHINSLPFHSVEQLGTSTLITRMTNDINHAQSGVNLVLRLFLRSPFIVVGAMIMALTVNVKLSLIFLLAIPVLSLVIYAITVVTIPIVKRVQAKLDAVLRAVRENLEGVRVIRAFNRQNMEKSDFQKSSNLLMRVQLLTGKISALMNPVTYVIVNIAIIAIIWYGGFEVEHGIITQGEVVALINYMSQILLALVALANLIIAFTKAMASGARIQEVFIQTSGGEGSEGDTVNQEENAQDLCDSDSSRRDHGSTTDDHESTKNSPEKTTETSKSILNTNGITTGVLESIGHDSGNVSNVSQSILENSERAALSENTNRNSDDEKNVLKKQKNSEKESSVCSSHLVFDNVYFSYPGAKEDALTNFTFSVEQGETIGIIGGTGDGKSTLMNIIIRLYDVTKGAVLVNGEDIRSIPPGQLRNRIGMVPQHAVLFHGSIRENIKWGKKDATDGEIREALEIAQAKEFIEKMKSGLDTLVAQGGKNLSGGQRQRLTIARALVRKPEILILDDSSSALDYATDARLQKAMKEKLKGTTLLIVSQRVANIRRADRILVLDDGEVVGFDNHENLIKECEVYQEIYLSQTSEEDAEHQEMSLSQNAEEEDAER